MRNLIKIQVIFNQVHEIFYDSFLFEVVLLIKNKIQDKNIDYLVTIFNIPKNSFIILFIIALINFVRSIIAIEIKLD